MIDNSKFKSTQETKLDSYCSLAILMHFCSPLGVSDQQKEWADQVEEWEKCSSDEVVCTEMYVAQETVC